MNSAFWYPFVLVLTLIASPKKDGLQKTCNKNSFSITSTNDTLDMIQIVKGFLHWYKINYSKANSFKFTYEDNQGNYQVNLIACKDYLQYLKNSGFISDEYISLWMKYFDDKATYLKENLQNEGPPEGFDFDLVLISQEPDLIFNAVEKLDFVLLDLKENKAVLQMSGEWMYDIDMTKENGKWMIDYIATANYD